MVLNSLYQITLSPLRSSHVALKGTNQVLLQKGVATFSNIVAVAKPGSKNLKIVASCKAIDSNKLASLNGGSVSSNQIMVNFRFCKPGEIQLSDNTCSECPSETYSLEWNSTK